MTVESNRERYLKEFSRMNNMNELFGQEIGEGVTNIGERIVQELKKEDLTHDEAYASLQYAYNKIRYESNFLKLWLVKLRQYRKRMNY